MRKLIYVLTLAAAISTAVSSSAWSQGAPAGHGGGSASMPWWGWCIIGAAAGPIWATLRLNKELKKDEAYVSMSWCGAGSWWLIWNQKYNKRG